MIQEIFHREIRGYRPHGRTLCAFCLRLGGGPPSLTRQAIDNRSVQNVSFEPIGQFRRLFGELFCCFQIRGRGPDVSRIVTFEPHLRISNFLFEISRRQRNGCRPMKKEGDHGDHEEVAS